jgi:hypothetical protein
MQVLHNAVCLTYIYPNGTHDNLTGMVTKLKRVGLPNCKEWIGVFHPNGGHLPIDVRVTSMDLQQVEPLCVAKL